MGIPRFTSFVDNNFTGWLKEEIKGNLVIDGYSLCYHLYSYDWSHGGQYSEYRNNVMHCFISMGQSGITPIVVMDGVDFKEEKVETVTKRRNNAIKTIHKHTSSNQRRQREVMVDGVLPPLTLKVFFMVMQELKVNFIVADGEGDKTIYELANMYSCPVLSKDSDFLMYKLKGGYIPLVRFHWEAMPISAEVYYYHSFCTQMKFNDPDVRLLIPAIAGNDFLPGIDSDAFLSHMGKQVQSKGHHNRLSTVVKYIGRFECLDDFIEQLQAIPCLTEQEKDILQDNCTKVRSYDSEKTTSLEMIGKVTELRAFNSEDFPEWILKQFRFGNLHCMEPLVLGKYMHEIFIDDSNASSCCHSSSLIRQYMYGLTGYSLVTEYCRDRLQLVAKGVHASTMISGHGLPPLSQIPVLSPSEREQLLYSILGCADDPQLLNLPEDWKLAMAATKFWVLHGSPSHHQVKALVLNFMVYATCPSEVPNMYEQFEIPLDYIRSNKWMPTIHAFSQWQSVYGDAINLNQLLMTPVTAVSPAHLYDGRLVMFFAYPENDDSFLASLPIDHALYEELLDVVLPKTPVARHQPPSRRSSGGGSGKSGNRTGEQPPRFRQMVPPLRGGAFRRGRGRSGSGSGSRYVPQGEERFNDVGHPTKEMNSKSRGSGGRRGHATNASASGGGQSHARGGRGSGRSRGASSTNGWNEGSGTGTRDGPKSHNKPQSSSKGAALRSAAPRAHVVVSEQPKFTHKNRFSALVADESSTSDESLSD